MVCPGSGSKSVGTMTTNTLSDRRYLSSYTATQRPLTLAAAVQTYLCRRDRATRTIGGIRFEAHPSGDFDKRGRWYPEASERCPCCDSIRNPSAAHPYSYMVHCRTAEHLAHQFGLALDDLQAAIRRADGRGGDETKSYKTWLSSREALQPRASYSGARLIGKTTHAA